MFDMKKQLMWSKLKVGAVLTIAILTLFITVFFAGNIENMLLPQVELKVQIRDVKGLRSGAPVWLSGIEVGSVKDIRLDPQHGTMVIISIRQNTMRYLKQDSSASVMTMGLLGDKYLEITTGSPIAEGLVPGGTIKGTAQIEFKDVIETSTESLQKISSVIEKVGRLIEKIEKGEGTLAKFLKDPTVYDNLKEATKTLSAITKDIKNSRGTLGLLIEDPSLYDKMLAASSSIEEFGKKLNEGDGTLKRLAEDAELYDNLNKASMRLSSILEKIDNGEGAAGSLIGDKELAQELKGTVSELKDLIKDIKENPKKYFEFSVF